MKILGTSVDVFISSAVLIENGKVIAGAAEERFNREKLSKNFPLNAINYCLQKAGCDIEDVDYITVGWNPGRHIKRLNSRFSSLARWRGEQLYAVPNFIMSKSRDKDIEHIEEILYQRGNEHRIIYVDHHLSHAASAYYPSPFKEAAILTVDGKGEDDTALYAVARKNKIKKLQSVTYPHTLGHLYGAFTDFLGFQYDADEWKVMALASYGNRNNKYYDILKKLVTFRKDGAFELDLKYFDFYLSGNLHSYNERLLKLFGTPREKHEPLRDRHYQVASALQQVTEEILAKMLNYLNRKTGMNTVVVAGGTFMNSVFNGKILQNTGFKKVFIPSWPDDSGVSLGSALWAYHNLLGGAAREIITHNYYGPEFSNDEIKKILAKYKITSRFMKDVEKYTAGLIHEGKIVGWFQGRMEFGQRALGNRSILADPRKQDMKNKVNQAVKYRETFRPFAPSILEEYTTDYFVCNKGTTVPFMEKVFMVHENKRDIIPAVVHVDGSGRLQTVSRRTNPRYYKLIQEFHKLSKVPILLNTSFNLKGEPIVCTPTDALRTFYTCGLDVLVMGNYVVSKSRT